MGTLKVVARERPEDLGAFDLWNDATWRRFGQVRSIALAGERFSGRLEQGAIAFLSICRISATAHRVEHPAEKDAAVVATHLKALFQLHGVCQFQQDGAPVELSAGELVIYDASSRYSLINPQAVEQIVVSIPADRISFGAVPRFKASGRKLSAQAGGGRLAIGLLRATVDELPNCGPHATSHVAETICHLLADAVREQVGEERPVSLKTVLRARVRDYIENNLADPELSVEQMAMRLNCSKRYLYEVFEDTGMTLSRYIWKRRLERCRDELVDLDRTKRSLTDIAFSWGFVSLAHFSKAFKQEFGATPSNFRAHRAPEQGPTQIERGL